MKNYHPLEEKTLKLYENIHPYNINELSIHNYLKTTGLDESFFKDKSILDCGFGGTGWALELFVKSGAREVAGVDLNEKWVQVHRERLKGYAVPLDLRAASALALPFKDNTFDYVHSNGVLHHTLDWKKGLSELARVTKPGGTIFLMLYGKFGPLGSVFHFTYRTLGKIIPLEWTRFLVNKTGLLRNPEISLLDAMYAPIEKHLSFDEIKTEMEKDGLSEIRWLESYKWKQHKILSSALFFGPKMQHNLLAKKR